MADLTLERLRELLEYNQETGGFTWRVRRGPARAGSKAGSVGRAGYLSIETGGRVYQAHRLAWFYVYGEWPLGDLDHKDMVKTNNRIDNLRLATPSQNKANSRLHRNNTSGLKGAHYRRRRRGGRWQAKIQQVSLGHFDTAEEAHAAYVKAAQERFGEFARSR